MKKFVLITTSLLLFSCASQSDKMQAEYFKDFQTQVLALSQRVELLEAKAKREGSVKSDISDRLDKIDDRLVELEKNLNKIKNHPLFEGLESVKLTQVPSSTVITIKPETVEKTVQPPAPVIVPVKEETKEKESVAAVQTEKKDVEQPRQISEPQKAENPVLELYNKGYDMYNTGKYPQAISIFREFLAKYPKDALADNAQYWIAESYYAQKLFDKAIAEFKKVENYPDRNKVPDAYLKIMYAYTEMGKKKEAAKWKDLLLKKYKDSEAAKKIQEKSTH